MTAPINEGEAEAQPPTPPVTVTWRDPSDTDRGERLVEFTVPAVQGRRAQFDALLGDTAVAHLTREGWEWQRAEWTWVVRDGVRARCLTVLAVLA